MTVGIADVATDLVLVVFWRVMELRVVSGRTNGKGKLSGATPEPRLVGPKSDRHTGVRRSHRAVPHADPLAAGEYLRGVETA
jgi:hypothetical protein